MTARNVFGKTDGSSRFSDLNQKITSWGRGGAGVTENKLNASPHVTTANVTDFEAQNRLTGMQKNMFGVQTNSFPAVAEQTAGSFDKVGITDQSQPVKYVSD